jgi:hypothetical protein
VAYNHNLASRNEGKREKRELGYKGGGRRVPGGGEEWFGYTFTECIEIS